MPKSQKRIPQVGDWCWSQDGERYWSTFATRQEAIDAAKDELLHPHEPGPREVLIARVGSLVDVADAVASSLDSDRICEDAEEYIYDNYGNEESLLEHISSEIWMDLEKRMRVAAEQWVEEHRIRADWYMVDHESVEKVTIQLEATEDARG